MITTDTRSSTEVTEVRVHIKNINLIMKNHIFDGTDPMRIFEFLARFLNLHVEHVSGTGIYSLAEFPRRSSRNSIPPKP